MAGLEHPHIIDVIAHDDRTGEVALIMVEPRAWDGSDARLFQLQEKINAYLSFALDGEMAEAYPRFIGKPLRLQLDCTAPPDARTQKLIDAVRAQIAFQQIKFDVRTTGAAGCGCAPESV